MAVALGAAALVLPLVHSAAIRERMARNAARAIGVTASFWFFERLAGFCT